MAGHHRGARRAPARSSRVRFDKAAALVVALGVTAFSVVAGVDEIGSRSGADDDAVAGSRPGTSAAIDRVRDAQPRQQAEQGARSVEKATDESTVPASSGKGRRVVFDMSAQRVWIVGGEGEVERTYLVSGSVTDNLKPGHYSVYSRSRDAVGVDDSGTMHYFVRFTRGENAAIGFHNIPVDDGQKVQTVAQLGTPMSHGCIRQKQSDAIAMWRFADLGTKVDVVA